MEIRIGDKFINDRNIRKYTATVVEIKSGFYKLIWEDKSHGLWSYEDIEKTLIPHKENIWNKEMREIVND